MTLVSPLTPIRSSSRIAPSSQQLKIALALLARGLTGKFVRVHIVEEKDFIGRAAYRFFLVPPDDEARQQLIGFKGNNVRAIRFLLCSVRVRLARGYDQEELPLIGKIEVL